MSTPAVPLARRGLVDVELSELDQALVEALDRQKVLYYPSGDSALPAAEAELLREGGFDLSARRRGPKDPLARGLAEHAALIKTSLSVAEAATLLGVSEGRIRQRLGKHELFGIPMGREWRLPRFQFGEDGELPGWSHVAAQLPAELSPVALAAWMATPNPDLVVGEEETPVSPREWLASGRSPKAVIRLVADLA